MKDKKTDLIAAIIKKYIDKKINKILAVGCGTGLEAAILHRSLRAEVIGIDIVEKFDPNAARLVKLQRGNAMALEFEDASFDFVYCYHALEHIQDPLRALEEINRVLRIGGHCWIGTPNRFRLIGYIGSKNAKLQEKVKWNLNDWKLKVKGRFKNELGAHAGFTNTELGNMLSTVFSEVKDTTNVYYRVLYIKYQYYLHWLQLLGLSKIVYPSIYFLTTK